MSHSYGLSVIQFENVLHRAWVDDLLLAAFAFLYTALHFVCVE